MRTLADLQVGDPVMRYLSSERIPMELTVTKIHEGFVHCGPWIFDQETGAEEDPYLRWGVAYGVTGSHIELLERR